MKNEFLDGIIVEKELVAYGSFSRSFDSWVKRMWNSVSWSQQEKTNVVNSLILNTVQSLPSGDSVLNFLLGNKSTITLNLDSTINVHNLSDGTNGSILVLRDDSNTETLEVNFYSDNGITSLTKVILGANNDIGTQALEYSLVTYIRYGNIVVVVYGHQYQIV